MNGYRDPIETYEKFSRAEIELEKSEEIWKQIEESISSSSNSSSFLNKWRSIRWKTVGVACAALFIVGGIFVDRPSIMVNLPPNSTNATETKLPLSGPVEVVSLNWRLVIAKSLLKAGPYYDIGIYYNGKKPILANQLTFSWEGSRTSTGQGETLQPGEFVSGFFMSPIQNGLAHVPPLKVSWVEGSPWVNGKDHSETLVLANAKPDLSVQNYHEYAGHGRKWTVTYAYETIVGKDFNQSRGNIVLQYSGKQIGNSVTYTISSNAGTQHMKYVNPQGNSIRLDVDPTQKGFNINSPSASVTIQWQGGTDKVTLTKVKETHP
ncbi:hypothetical protein [Alicyclobacillus dauci]|uniref:DUF4179 domain-containing protein n=1 Tax=Alicyclobacillus dauci TaxID=1475485 RepID=A0ABY6Z508_9BACL|nr:hypothetical protein [Alicyclobacillus dauci]WAH37839.1 hypothetical protein NZD86_04855 [Alicyclobacillus dauci]